jgi:hypothetical protein
MHLLQKRIMYLNSDDALTDSNDTRGDLWIPVPQHLPDPSATDLVFKMYIQDAVIVNDNMNINASNGKFTVTVTVNTPEGFKWDLLTQTYTFSETQMTEIDFVEMWQAVFGGKDISVEGNSTMPAGIKAAVKGFQSFRLEWTAAAYENDRHDNGYRPAIERTDVVDPPYPPFMPLGDKLMCLVTNVKGNGDDSQLEGREIVWMVQHLQVSVTALNPAGAKLLGMDPQPTVDTATVQLTPFWAAQYPSPILLPGTFEGPNPNTQSYKSPDGREGQVYNAVTQQWTNYPSYEAARSAAAMANDMLLDDFTQLHINTDLPVQNSEVRKVDGLSQTRITALVPVGVPHGGTIYYQDVNGINAAYERNQSTLSRLHIWLTDKYGKAYNPASPWTFSFALEIWQDDFKRMLDVLLASQSLHESTVKLHKLGLVGASFQALE